ncbi:hypothetical protein GEMRC1_012419 [Eukaryota sp. GEM-RC1]
MSFRAPTTSLPTLYEQGFLHDVIVTIRDSQFKLHRAILAHSSSRFSSMFSKEQHISRVQHLDFSSQIQTNPAGLNQFFEYFYGNEVHITSETLPDWTSLAEFFEIQDLIATCSSFNENISNSSALSLSLDTETILSSIYAQKEFCDYFLSFNGTKLHVHKFLLGYHCNFFTKLWNNETDINEYDLVANFTPTTIQPPNLEALISSLYGQELLINLENAYDLLHLADVMYFKSLSDRVKKVILENSINSDWVLSLLERADKEDNSKLLELLTPALQTLAQSDVSLDAVAIRPLTLLKFTQVDLTWRIKCLVMFFKANPNKITWTSSQIKLFTDPFIEQAFINKIFSVFVKPLLKETWFVDFLLQFSVTCFSKFSAEIHQIPSEWLEWCLSVSQSSDYNDDVIAVIDEYQKRVENSEICKILIFSSPKPTNLEYREFGIFQELVQHFPILAEFGNPLEEVRIVVNTQNASRLLQLVEDINVKHPDQQHLVGDVRDFSAEDCCLHFVNFDPTSKKFSVNKRGEFDTKSNSEKHNWDRRSNCGHKDLEEAFYTFQECLDFREKFGENGFRNPLVCYLLTLLNINGAGLDHCVDDYTQVVESVKDEQEL